MLVEDIMTHKVVAIDSEASVAQAAALMKEHDIGSLLVLADQNARGIVTDRDIVIRALSVAQEPTSTKVGEVASENLIWCRSDYSIENAAEIMKKEKIRRLLVVAPSYQPMGIVSLGDLATKAHASVLAGEILAQICGST